MAALCLLSVISAQAQDYLQLQYQFSQGDRFELLRHSTQDSYLEIQGVTRRTTRQLRDTLLLTVAAADHGGATITATFRNIFLLASGDNQQMTINTAAGDDDIFNRLFKKIINRPFTITMDAAGNIKTVSGLQETLDAMQQTLEGRSADEKEAFHTLIREQFGPEALKASLQEVLPVYPDHEVRTGDSWSNFLYTGGSMAGQTDYYWKLDYGDKYAMNLSSNGKFSTDPQKVVPLGEGMKGTINLNGTTQGKYAVDPTTGWPSLCIQHLEVSGNYHYRPNPNMKRGLTVPVRIVSDLQCQIRHL